MLSALASTLVPTEVRASGIATVQTVVATARFASSLGFGLLWVWLGRGPALYALAAALAVSVPWRGGSCVGSSARQRWRRERAPG